MAIQAILTAQSRTILGLSWSNSTRCTVRHPASAFAFAITAPCVCVSVKVSAHLQLEADHTAIDASRLKSCVTSCFCITTARSQFLTVDCCVIVLAIMQDGARQPQPQGRPSSHTTFDAVLWQQLSCFSVID